MVLVIGIDQLMDEFGGVDFGLPSEPAECSAMAVPVKLSV
jgi:hypothetical protein